MSLGHVVFGTAAVLLIAVAGVYWFTVAMPGRSHAGALPPITEAERAMARLLRLHVEAVASRPHNTSHPHALEASARAIEARLVELGYAPIAQRFLADGIEVRNVEVVIEPAATAKPGAVTTVVVGAHYDSAGHAPGANDNGSGVAALLILARDLKTHVMTATRLRLVFFVNEEPPHFKTETMGSLVYARALLATGERVRAMLALETLGCYSDEPGSQKYPDGLAKSLGFALPAKGDFLAIVGTPSARALAADVTRLFRAGTAFPSIGGVAPGVIPGITWSDHWSFAQFGIPAVMLTDTAPFRYPHYHTPNDTPDKLDYDRLARVTAGIARVVRGLAR